MGQPKSPLKATISTVELSLGGTAANPQGSIALTDYLGDPLYYHVSSAAGTLTIAVDGFPGNTSSANAAASSAEIVINLPTLQTARIVFPHIAYTAGTDLFMNVSVTSDLAAVTIAFTDEVKQYNDKKDAKLRFVLVQKATLVEPRYRLEWIRDEIWIEDAAHRADASVVEPVPSVGGAMGPMGLATP